MLRVGSVGAVVLALGIGLAAPVGASPEKLGAPFDSADSWGMCQVSAVGSCTQDTQVSAEDGTVTSSMQLLDADVDPGPGADMGVWTQGIFTDTFKLPAVPASSGTTESIATVTLFVDEAHLDARWATTFGVQNASFYLAGDVFEVATGYRQSDHAFTTVHSLADYGSSSEINLDEGTITYDEGGPLDDATFTLEIPFTRFPGPATTYRLEVRVGGAIYGLQEAGVLRGEGELVGRITDVSIIE